MRMTRREILIGAAAAVAASAAPTPDIEASVVARNDASVESLLKNQETDPKSYWRGSNPDYAGLHTAGSAAQILETFSASLVYPKSRFFQNAELMQRMRLAAGFLERTQSPEGFISLLSTNFNSPPDTGFIVHGVASGAIVARMYGNEEAARIPQAFLQKAGAGLAVGGIHTPNHRWVVSSALAQIDELFPDPRYLKRIDQWLAEGIDIDADGEFTERSMLTYNVICDRAFIVLAAKLKRPELLSPVRKNLHSLLYLLHGDGEVVTEISRRQDVNTRGDAGRYWFASRYLALTDRNPQLATLAKLLTSDNATLPAMLEYPMLTASLPLGAPLPDNYEKPFPELGIERIRRGQTSATVMLSGNSRFFSLRHGDVVIGAVRFATAFFGKGQFIPDQGHKKGNSFVLTQSLQAPYYQPLDHEVKSANWAAARAERQQTQICRLQQTATITEIPKGFRLRIQSEGTPSIPIAIEIAFREGGTIQNCAKSKIAPDTWVLQSGEAVYRAGKNTIGFGPGKADQMYTQIRGAEPKLPGPGIYLTGFTPFDHTIEFECA
jgi:hypothetical protein